MIAIKDQNIDVVSSILKDGRADPYIKSPVPGVKDVVQFAAYEEKRHPTWRSKLILNFITEFTKTKKRPFLV